jgi:hypothetical protein
MAMKQDVNAPLIVTIGVVSGLLLLVVVFGLQAWFVREERAEIEDKWSRVTNASPTDLRAAQQARIERTGEVDENGTKTRMVSIHTSMQVLAQRNGMLPSTKPTQQQQPPKKQ